MKALLEAGAKIDSPEFPASQHLMMTAADEGNPEVIRMLIAAGVAFDVENQYGVTPVAAAAEQGHLEAVKVFIDAGADLSVKGDYGNIAVLSAAMSGNREIVKALLDAGADVTGDVEKLQQYSEDPEIRKMIAEAAKR